MCMTSIIILYTNSVCTYIQRITVLDLTVLRTVYALIFVWFNIRGIRRLEAIWESLDPQKFRLGSCAKAKHGRLRILKRENRTHTHTHTHTHTRTHTHTHTHTQYVHTYTQPMAELHTHRSHALVTSTRPSNSIHSIALVCPLRLLERECNNDSRKTEGVCFVQTYTVVQDQCQLCY